MTRRRRLDTLEVLTVDEVAAILRVRRALVYDLLRRGELRGVKVRSLWRVPRVALEEFLAGEREADRASIAAVILEAFRRDDNYRTAREVARLVGIREREARHALIALTHRGDLQFHLGPPGRSPSAKCWRLADREAELQS